jgi:hypothetical protein
VPNSENTSMNAVKVSGAQSGGAALAVDTRSLELLERNHAVLPRGDPSNQGVGRLRGAFCMHGDA